MEQYTHEDGSDTTIEVRCVSLYMEEMFALLRYYAA